MFEIEKINGIKHLIFDPAKIMFENFSGTPSRYNQAGDKNFSLVIEDPKDVDYLKEQGWNIRTLPALDDGTPELHLLPVKISFKQIKHIPPTNVTLIADGVHTMLDDDTIGRLDHMWPTKIAVTIRPRMYLDEKSGKQKIKAYLATMMFFTELDTLSRRYAEAEYPKDDDPEDGVPF